MVTKKDIRIQCLQRRSELSLDEQTKKSRIITRKVVNHPMFISAEDVYCYIDFKNEVQTKSIINQAWKMGKRVAVPRISKETMSMEFYYIHNYEALEEGYFGVLEPKKLLPKANGEEGIMIIPCVGFDSETNRIGYGKGFYDNYLMMHPSIFKMMIAYNTQHVSNIPVNHFDVKPDMVITEG